MAYVHRNTLGEIDSISETANEHEQEYLPIDNVELITYLKHSNNSDEIKTALSASDVALIRVLEDLINTLVDQKVILFTDLPLAAREKLSEREKIRGHLTTLDNLMGDDDGIL
ncbi:MAG: hypothetical protein PSN44_08110 [Gammaproteobacteria bacterium]|nr:hypothetical protein [Gammaproteobacteria bacterium]